MFRCANCECRQLIPVLFGALLSVTFGMTLGWPSVTYPFLLNYEVSPIKISIDQTALVAGILMEANTVGSLLSTSTFISSKLAVCLCCSMQICGWLIMYFSIDIYWFLVSRTFIGFAHGYGIGQLKRYVSETCRESLSEKIYTFLPIGVNVGILIIFTSGAFVGFRSQALYCLLVPSTALIGFGLIPKKSVRTDPMQLQSVNSVKTIAQDVILANAAIPIAQRVMSKAAIPVAPTVMSNAAIPVAQRELSSKPASVTDQVVESPQTETPLTVMEVLKDPESRNGLFLIFLLVCVQQYSGGSATIIFSQIVFISSRNQHPKLCSILYALVGFVSMILALTHAQHINRKANLIVSTLVCAISITLLAVYFFLRTTLLQLHQAFVWAPLLLLVLFNFFHTFSFATLPLLLLNESLPKRCLNVLGKFWTIHYSLSAVISTKVFQVIFSLFGMAPAYALFAVVLIVSFFISVFVKDYTPKGKLTISRSRKDTWTDATASC